MYGVQVQRSKWRRRRDVIGAVEQSAAGNVIVRGGTELGFDGAGWAQTFYVVLEPREALQLAAAIMAAIDPADLSLPAS